jgi:hypothetical protein
MRQLQGWYNLDKLQNCRDESISINNNLWENPDYLGKILSW